MSTKDQPNPYNIRLENVRLSFPNLYKKSSYLGETTANSKYGATFLIPKSDRRTKKKIDAMMEKLIKEKKLGKVKSDKYCIKDGDDSEYDNFIDNWSIKATNKKRPKTIDRKREQVDEEDELFYAGCYVNAVIQFWAQDNKYGKRVNANLLGVQFVKDGEAFGNQGIDVDEEFDDIDEDDFDDEFDDEFDDL